MTNEGKKGGAPIDRAVLQEEIDRYNTGKFPVTPETCSRTRFKVKNVMKYLESLEAEEIDLCHAVGDGDQIKFVIMPVNDLQFSKDGGDPGFNFGTTCPPDC